MNYGMHVIVIVPLVNFRIEKLGLFEMNIGCF